MSFGDHNLPDPLNVTQESKEWTSLTSSNEESTSGTCLHLRSADLCLHFEVQDLC